MHRQKIFLKTLKKYSASCIFVVYINFTDLLFAYLLTPVSRQIFEDNCREYGNGLQKFEPNDINKSMMLDLERLDAATEKEILGDYHLYRQSVLDKMPDERFIELMDEVFVGCFT